MASSSDEESDDLTASLLLQAICGYRKQLENVRDVFYFEDLRVIGAGNINSLESVLRSILKGMFQWQSEVHFAEFVSSYVAVQLNINKVLDNLYVADSIVKKHRPTVRDQEKLYVKLHECGAFLGEALDYFNV